MQARNETLRVPSWVGQDDSLWQQIVRAPENGGEIAVLGQVRYNDAFTMLVLSGHTSFNIWELEAVSFYCARDGVTCVINKLSQ